MMVVGWSYTTPKQDYIGGSVISYWGMSRVILIPQSCYKVIRGSVNLDWTLAYANYPE